MVLLMVLQMCHIPSELVPLVRCRTCCEVLRGGAISEPLIGGAETRRRRQTGHRLLLQSGFMRSQKQRSSVVMLLSLPV